jgi:hypothetical protein
MIINFVLVLALAIAYLLLPDLTRLLSSSSLIFIPDICVGTSQAAMSSYNPFYGFAIILIVISVFTFNFVMEHNEPVVAIKHLVSECVLFIINASFVSQSIDRNALWTTAME